MNGTHGANMKVSVIRCKLVVILCLAALGLVPQWSRTQSPSNRVMVANVYFDGVQNLPIEKVMNFVYTKPGREFSTLEAQGDIARLAASRLVKPLDVRTEATTDGRINVIFVVREFRNSCARSSFKHAKHVTVKELEGMTRAAPRDAARPDAEPACLLRDPGAPEKEGPLLRQRHPRRRLRREPRPRRLQHHRRPQGARPRAFASSVKRTWRARPACGRRSTPARPSCRPWAARFNPE